VRVAFALIVAEFPTSRPCWSNRGTCSYWILLYQPVLGFDQLYRRSVPFESSDGQYVSTEVSICAHGGRSVGKRDLAVDLRSVSAHSHV
jgi:hypothetical protein